MAALSLAGRRGGGGACSTGPGASKLNGYNESDLANESKLRNDLYLSNKAANPFAGMSCTTVERTRVYNPSLDPASRYAFLSFRCDDTTANGRKLAEFDRDLGALVARIPAEPNARTFIADNSRTGFGPPTLHVITTQRTPPTLLQAHAEFIGAMVSGNGWTSRRFVMP